VRACVYVRVWMRVCARVHARVCVRACVHVRVCVCAYRQMQCDGRLTVVEGFYRALLLLWGSEENPTESSGLSSP